MTRPRARPRRPRSRARARARSARPASPAKHLEITIGYVREWCDPDRGTAVVELGDEAVEGCHDTPRARRTPRLRRRRAPDAPRSRGRRPEDRSRAPRRARSSTGRSGSGPDTHHSAATQLASGSDATGPRTRTCSNVLVGATRERQLVAIAVEVPVEPGDVGALVRVVGPARRDDSYTPSGEGLALGRRMEDRRVGCIRDHVRVDELDPEREMRVAAVPRLHDRRVGEFPVDLRDSRVRPVVEAAVGRRSDRRHGGGSARRPGRSGGSGGSRS